MDSKDDTSIRVICRIKPTEGPLPSHLEIDDTSILVRSANPSKSENPISVYTFDRVLFNTVSQSDVYNIAASATVEDVLNGYNGTIFAYGQTGSGKTFTMFGPDICSNEDRGIIPRACSHIFKRLKEDEDGTEYSLKCSFLEIYKENLRDLLNPSRGNLKVRESAERGVYIEFLTEQRVNQENEVLELLRTGEKSRVVSSTKMNSVSSRSHSIFIMSLNRIFEDGSTKQGKLNLVDLAGSEKVGKTGATGETLEEAKQINQSLSALGNCINALTKSKSAHVPYRDSKLTFLLRESLGGNCKTTLMIACSPAKSNIEETISTLKFGQRAKTIKNDVVQNKHEDPNQTIGKLNKELSVLKDYIQKLESQQNDNNLQLKLQKKDSLELVVTPKKGSSEIRDHNVEMKLAEVDAELERISNAIKITELSDEIQILNLELKESKNEILKWKTMSMSQNQVNPPLPRRSDADLLMRLDSALKKNEELKKMNLEKEDLIQSKDQEIDQIFFKYNELEIINQNLSRTNQLCDSQINSIQLKLNQQNEFLEKNQDGRVAENSYLRYQMRQMESEIENMKKADEEKQNILIELSKERSLYGSELMALDLEIEALRSACLDLTAERDELKRYEIEWRNITIQHNQLNELYQQLKLTSNDKIKKFDILIQKNYELELKIKDLRQDKAQLDSKLMENSKKLDQYETLMNDFEIELERERQTKNILEYGIQRQISRQMVDIESKMHEDNSSPLDDLNNACHEVLQTERNYVKDLKIIVHKFYEPIQNDIKSLGISSMEFNIIFGNVRNLVELHSTLLEQLEIIFRNHSTKDNRHFVIAHPFNLNSENMKDIYTKYTINCQSALDLLIRLKKNSKFTNFLNEIHKDASLNKLRLDDYLVKPIKRLALYPLLLKAIISLSPKNENNKSEKLSMQFGNLSTVLVRLEEITETINKIKQEKETSEKIQSIKLSGFNNDQFTTNNGKRIFVNQHNLLMHSEKKSLKIIVYVFNDVLVAGSDGKLAVMIPLDGSEILDLPDNNKSKNRFRLDYYEHQFIFSASNDLEKELILKEFINKTKLKKNENKSERYT